MVERASAADLRPLSAVLGRAFVDDPGWTWIYRQPDRAGRLETMFRSLLPASVRGGGLVLCDEARRGAAIWQESHRRDLGTRGKVAMGLAMLRGRADMRRTRTLALALDGCRPTEPHWYLATLGTDPGHQGRGISSGLVRHHLDSPATTTKPAYLEVLREENVGFYEQFGFERIGELDVPDDGPHVWLMWREVPPPPRPVSA